MSDHDAVEQVITMAWRAHPDLSWWQQGVCEFVGDIKYKKPIGKAKNADLYQLLAYVTGTSLPVGLLVYVGNEDETIAHQVKGSDRSLHLMAIRIDGALADLRLEIQRVAVHVRHLREREPVPAQPSRAAN